MAPAAIARTGLPTDLSGLLQCPACAASLEATGGCPACGTRFPVQDGQPVLINFADSIFSADEYRDEAPNSKLQTGTAIGRLIARITYGTGKVAQQNIMTFHRLLTAKPGRRLLVIGGGSIGAGAEILYDDPEIDLTGTDIFATRNTSLVCDGHNLPFRDASFDGVLIQAVIEHVLDPHRVVGEIHRVLRDDGLVLAETPFIQQVHMGAYDFTRFTFSGHRWLFRRFDEVEAGPTIGPGVALIWSIAQMARAVGLGSRGSALVTLPWFWLRFLDRFMPRGEALDGASGVYFLGRKSTSALSPHDMLNYFEANRR